MNSVGALIRYPVLTLLRGKKRKNVKQDNVRKITPSTDVTCTRMKSRNVCNDNLILYSRRGKS